MSLSLRNNTNLISPTNLTEAMEFAKMISSSSFCPNSMKGKPGDVIIAMQMGSEVGLSPMQAIQNIAVINGKPCLWGDAALAIVLGHSQYESHREWLEGSIADGTLTAYCGITRKGSDEHIKQFSITEAKKANLWGKPGPWTQYPERMLQMRARGFAIRDKFADALRGINFAEEVRDYQTIEVTKEPKIVPIKNNIALESPMSDGVDINTGEILCDETNELELKYTEFSNDIKVCQDLDKLQELFIQIKKIDFKKRPDLFKKLIDEKDMKKNELIIKNNMEKLSIEENT